MSVIVPPQASEIGGEIIKETYFSNRSNQVFASSGILITNSTVVVSHPGPEYGDVVVEAYYGCEIDSPSITSIFGIYLQKDGATVQDCYNDYTSSTSRAHVAYSWADTMSPGDADFTLLTRFYRSAGGAYSITGGRGGGYVRVRRPASEGTTIVGYS